MVRKVKEYVYVVSLNDYALGAFFDKKEADKELERLRTKYKDTLGMNFWLDDIILGRICGEY